MRAKSNRQFSCRKTQIAVENGPLSPRTGRQRSNYTSCTLLQRGTAQRLGSATVPRLSVPRKPRCVRSGPFGRAARFIRKSRSVVRNGTLDHRGCEPRPGHRRFRRRPPCFFRLSFAKCAAYIRPTHLWPMRRTSWRRCRISMPRLRRPSRSSRRCAPRSSSPAPCWRRSPRPTRRSAHADFDIENARIEDVVKQQKVMEGNIADLIIGLEDATNVFGTEFESMKSFTGWETFVGIFSDAEQAAHAHRPRRATCRLPAICRSCSPSPTPSSAS